MNIVSTQLGNSLYNCVRSNLRWPLWTRSHFTYYPTRMGTGKRMNMFNAINNAIGFGSRRKQIRIVVWRGCGIRWSFSVSKTI